MRGAVALLTVLTVGGLSPAFADPPPTPVAPESQSATAPNSTAEDSRAQNSIAPTATAPVTAAEAETPAAAAAKLGAPDQGMQEKLLRAQGYKLSMVNGEEAYCRREIPSGSHLPVLHCVSLASAEAMAKEGRQLAERIQRSMPGCLSNGSGGAICH